MATLQKIRNHGTLLLVVVGVAMLAFILGDFLNSGSSFFNRNRNNVGEIEDHKIPYTDYTAAVDVLTDWYKVQFNTNNLEEDVMANIRNQVWQDMMAEYIFDAQAKEIGLHVTDEDMNALCQGQSLHPWVMNSPLFKDENGGFSRAALANFLNWYSQNGADMEENEQVKPLLNHWKYIQKRVRLDCMQTKYTKLLQSMITYNDIDAEFACMADQYSVDAQYIKVPYSVISDDQINIKKSDLKKKYTKRKRLYKQTPNCSLEYVSFPINPSQEDFANMEARMLKEQESFATSENVAEVVKYSESRIKYYGQNYSEETIPEAYKDFAFAAGAKKNDLMELTLDGDIYRMARLMDCGYSLPDSVQLRPFVTGREDLQAQWMNISVMPEGFVDSLMKAKLNEPFVAPNGDSLVCIERSKATPKVKVAMIECQVAASTKTHSSVYNKAKQFIFASGNAAQFRENAKKEGLNINPVMNLEKNADRIGNIKQSRQIVKWAFDGADEGEVSDVFEYNDQCVVAILLNLSDEEYKTINEVEDELRPLIIREKKGNCLTAVLKNMKSLDEIAAVVGDSIQYANNIVLSGASFGNEGAEPAAVGAAFATAQGEMSAPVAGENGVYVLVPGQKQLISDAAIDEAAIQQKRDIMNMNLGYMFNQGMIMKALQDQAEIEDNRFNFQ